MILEKKKKKVSNVWCKASYVVVNVGHMVPSSLGRWLVPTKDIVTTLIKCIDQSNTKLWSIFGHLGPVEKVKARCTIDVLCTFSSKGWGKTSVEIDAKQVANLQSWTMTANLST